LACAAFAGCAVPAQRPVDEGVPFAADAFGKEARDQEPDTGEGLPASGDACDGGPAAAPSSNSAPVCSAYDLEAILLLNPAWIPATLEGLGFEYEMGAPTGAWESI